MSDKNQNTNSEDDLLGDDLDISVAENAVEDDSDPVEFIDRPTPKSSSATYALIAVVLLALGGAGYVFIEKPSFVQDLLHGSQTEVDTGTISPVVATTPDAPAVEQAPQPSVIATSDDVTPYLQQLESIAASLPLEQATLPPPVTDPNITLVPQSVPTEVQAGSSVPQEYAAAGLPPAPAVESNASVIDQARRAETPAPKPEKKAQLKPSKPDVKVGDEGLEFFDAGQPGTIGPGSDYWQAQEKTSTSETLKNKVIVSAQLTRARQDSKMSAARNAFLAGRYETALRFYNELYALNKRDVAVLIGRAMTLQKLGRAEDAAKAYDDVLSVDPENKQAIVNMLGIVQKEYPAVAAERLRTIYNKYPDSPEVIAQLGLAQAQAGNYEEALQYLARATSIQPNNPQHAYNMAVIAERMGKPDLAVTYYERALQSDSSSGMGHVNREVIYDRLSRLRR